MTQHKVVADDSLSAMDEISKVLGKDAVILKTQKVNGKIEILGSNNIEDVASSNAKKLKKQTNKEKTTHRQTKGFPTFMVDLGIIWGYLGDLLGIV